MNVDEFFDKLFNLLQSQKFADWYSNGGSFDRWIRGELCTPSEEEVKKELMEMIKRRFKV